VPPPRSSISITLSVWKGLFLREALTRLFSGRASWFWLFLEPIFHIALLMFIFSVIRVRHVGGIDTAVWIMVGFLAFFMFRRTGRQAIDAVGANEALFTYRQVKPVDTVLVRCVLEGFLMTIISCLLMAGAALFGYSVIPEDPLGVFKALFGLWLVGMGFGLVVSVCKGLVPEVGEVMSLAMRPMYFISGVIFPISMVPQPYRDWLLLNPVAHGIEAARLGFAEHYHAIAESSMSYTYSFALVSIFLGLVLHRRFALTLATK